LFSPLGKGIRRSTRQIWGKSRDGETQRKRKYRLLKKERRRNRFAELQRGELPLPFARTGEGGNAGQAGISHVSEVIGGKMGYKTGPARREMGGREEGRETRHLR